MENIKKIIPFVLPYKSHIVWNIIYNIFYALFSTLSFLVLIPMMDVLFQKSKKIDTEPVLKSIFDIGSYAKEYLYFEISKLNEANGPQYALLLAVVVIIITFLLKNVFGYLASFHLMH